MKPNQMTQPRPPNLGSGQDQLNALVSFYSRGRLKEALSLGTALAARYPKVPLIPNLLGAVYAGMGRKQEAVGCYRKALALKSDYAEAHNNLGVALNDLGKPEEALASFSSAVKIRPDYAEAHTNLGNALKSLGRHDDAIASHRQAVQLKPDFAGAHNNLGNTYQDLGKHEDAVASYLKAIEIRPDYAQAQSNLGNALRDLGRYDEAITSYREAIQLRPDLAEAHFNLGSLLHHLERYDEALSHLTTAIEIRPDYVEAHCGLCVLLESLNRISDLKSAVQSANEKCAENHPSIARITGLLAFREKRFREAKSILRSIDAARLPETEQVYLCDLLGQVCDKCGEYAEAFQFFKKSNDINASLRVFQNLDAAWFTGLIERLIQSYGVAPKGAWGGSETSEPDRSKRPPVFLVGFPRSGTTLLDTILMSHRKISVIEEKPLLRKLAEELDYDIGFERLAALAFDHLENLSEKYFKQRQQHLGRDDADIVIDKNPFNIVNISLANRIFPRSKIILVLRHPCDCVLSCFMQNFKPNAAMGNFLNLHDSAGLYDRTMTLWQVYKDVLPFESYIVKYEDLIEDLQGTATPLLEFLGLEWSEELSNYQTTAMERGRISTPSYRQVTEKLYKQSSGRWVNYREEMEPVLPLLEPWISKWGYA